MSTTQVVASGAGCGLVLAGAAGAAIVAGTVAALTDDDTEMPAEEDNKE